VKIALVVAGFQNGNIGYNSEKIIDALRQYQSRADLLVFDEAFLQGFTWKYDKDTGIAVLKDSAPIKDIMASSQKANVAVSFGQVAIV
jgi:predicted amidohydrolase